MERANRTIRDCLVEEGPTNDLELPRVLVKPKRRYNEERPRTVPAYLPPWEFYRADPPRTIEERRVELSQA